MALEIGAQAYGHWSSCHAVAWDLNAAALRRPARGRHVPEALVPARAHRQRARRALRGRGRRLPQLHLREVRARDPPPAAAAAFQIFDQKTVELLREEYRIRQVTKARGGHHRGARREARDRSRGARPHRARVQRGGQGPVPFNPAVLDGKRHARASRRPSPTGRSRSTRRPTWASAVTCGITFTFGGLRVDTRGRGARHRRTGRSPASTRRASWWAGSSTTTTRAAPASCRARSSARPRATPSPPTSKGSGLEFRHLVGRQRAEFVSCRRARKCRNVRPDPVSRA